MSVKRTIATYDRIAADYAHRWQDRTKIARAMARFLDLVPPRAPVLDVGCGPGFDCEWLGARGARVMGIDLSLGMLRVAKSRGACSAFVQADMRRLPLADDAGGIWCNAALLHLSRQDAMLTLLQFHKSLQEGGSLFLSVKEGRGEDQRSEDYGPDAPRYFTYWQGADLDAALRESGFLLVESWADDAPKHRWLCRLAQK